jgi:excisionase family DNA binding protein
MNNRITRREVAKQFIIAIELLLEWIEQGSDFGEKSVTSDSEDESLDTRLLTAPDVARILNISKGAAYKLIQQGKIPSIRIIRNVRVKQKDLKDFVVRNRA